MTNHSACSNWGKNNKKAGNEGLVHLTVSFLFSGYSYFIFLSPSCLFATWASEVILWLCVCVCVYISPNLLGPADQLYLMLAEGVFEWTPHWVTARTPFSVFHLELCNWQGLIPDWGKNLFSLDNQRVFKNKLNRFFIEYVVRYWELGSEYLNYSWK